jgi:hypothetical protein
MDIDVGSFGGTYRLDDGAGHSPAPRSPRRDARSCGQMIVKFPLANSTLLPRSIWTVGFDCRKGRCESGWDGGRGKVLTTPSARSRMWARALRFGFATTEIAKIM